MGELAMGLIVVACMDAICESPCILTNYARSETSTTTWLGLAKKKIDG